MKLKYEQVVGIFLVAVILFALIGIARGQVSEPNLYLRLAQDQGGYYMTCIQGCEYYNTLGTVDELNRHFPQYHCAVNWSYELRNRRRGPASLLGYLVGPNGDTSNPLCGG